MKKIYSTPAINVMPIDSADLMAATTTSTTTSTLQSFDRQQEAPDDLMFSKRSSGSFWKSNGEEQ